jgi:HEAT repeat protein
LQNKLLPLLLLTLLTAATMSAQGVEARFTTGKENYIAGEPVFVALTVSNKGNKPAWIDFKLPVVTNFSFFCEDFAFEVPGAESAQEQWGCGIAGSCGRSFREVLPGKSLSLRQLVNSQFRLQPGVYGIHAYTTIVVLAQDLFDSPQIAQFDVTDTLPVKVQRSNENQLEAAFQSYVEELNSPDLLKRGEAANAITELATPFLEDVLIEMTKSSYAGAAINALRKAGTVKTRETLGQIATSSGDSGLGFAAIRNLGRAGDMTYLPALLRLMQSDDKQIQYAAAEAVGNLGGAEAVQQLAALVSRPDEQTRVAGANGLGVTHARKAVPVLVGLLLDSDANVRQAAISALYLLTHRAALEGNQWADVTSPQSAAAVHQRWVRWWNSHGNDSEIHGMADCAPPKSLD